MHFCCAVILQAFFAWSGQEKRRTLSASHALGSSRHSAHGFLRSLNNRARLAVQSKMPLSRSRHSSTSYGLSVSITSDASFVARAVAVAADTERRSGVPWGPNERVLRGTLAERSVAHVAPHRQSCFVLDKAFGVIPQNVIQLNLYVTNFNVTKPPM